MKFRTVTSYANYGVTLSEVKDYIKVENPLEDSLISTFITASFSTVRNMTGRDFVETQYAIYNVSGSASVFAGLQEVSDLNVGEQDGVWIFLDKTYIGDVTYTVSKGVTVVPTDVKIAQFMLISHWWENRGVQSVVNMSPLAFSVEAILSQYTLINI